MNEMTEETARTPIDLWNQVPPEDSIERDARLVFLNQSIGFLKGLEAGRKEARPLVDELFEAAKRILNEYPQERDGMDYDGLLPVGIKSLRIAVAKAEAYKSTTSDGGKV